MNAQIAPLLEPRGKVIFDLAELFHDSPTPTSAAGRWVFVRAGDRHLALAVSLVLGVRALDEAAAEAGPEVAAPFISSVGRYAGRLVTVLAVARILPNNPAMQGQARELADG